MCCKVIVEILINQQDRVRREALTQQIVQDLGESNSF